jgi:beta-glucanase (GH16 family)
LVVNFENSQVGTSSVDFGGEASSITSEGLPAGGSANNYTALKTVKGSIGWSGVSFFAKPGTSLITSTHKTISANVWSSAAGSAIRLKVENNSDLTKAVETDAITSAAGWQRLTWNFDAAASGTPSFNASTIYDKLTVFPQFGSTTAGAVFWIDDVSVLGATPPALGAPAPTPTPTPVAPPANGTKVLLWSQEFNGGANSVADTSAWSNDLGDGSIFGNPGWGNNELQFYTNDSARLDGAGNLAITATKTSNGYSCYIGTCYWKSAKLTTKQKVGFKFGYLETRLKSPAGAGMWPAVWMLGANLTENGGSVPWPDAGEIDIYEGKGSNPFTVWGTPHNRNIHSGGTINSSTSLTDNYHTYAINWSQDRIQWYFNGQLFHEFKATDPGAQPYPFNLEFYLILNLAIGGGFGGPVDQSLTTGTMSIDYIRFYSNDGVGQVFVR